MIKEKVEWYLEYCEYRKELDVKTLKAYRIDLRQYFDFFQRKNQKRKELKNTLLSFTKNISKKR